jgi:hypothetical protein
MANCRIAARPAANCRRLVAVYAIRNTYLNYQSSALGGRERTREGTKANVSVEIKGGERQLKFEEKVAFMFVSAIGSIQDGCRRHAGHACTMAELVGGTKSTDGWPVAKLKFDPTRTDPNYTYKVAVKEKNWELWVTPRKPGLGGFHAAGGTIPNIYYNAKGEASAADVKITGHSIDGEIFSAQ